MHYVDQVGEVRLQLAPCGHGRLDLGAAALHLSQQNVVALLEVVNRLHQHLTAKEQQGAKPAPPAEPLAGLAKIVPFPRARIRELQV